MNNYDKLIAILREIFQIDQADLDFGIYRIMNQKREEINEFLEKKLIPQVKEEIAKSNLGDASAIQQELEEAIAGAKTLGMNPDDVPKVKAIKAQLATTQPIERIEEEVFSHLAAFFKRYYDNGDFISLRRYKKDVYAIPYEGEEVKLYWANHDQYYIKSSEYLKNYQFKVGQRKVKFELVEASTEQNNNKAQNGKERQFRIYEEQPITVADDTLIIYFTYLPAEKKVKREELNSLAFETIKTTLPADWVADVLQKAPTKSNAERTLLEKHINDFTARNTFDYFIHKDLGGFLRRELDFYIKNEVLHIDDINTNDAKDFTRQLTKIKALKVIAQKVITFLEQIENFQKRLWLKKKFVVETNYCITLDKIPESYYPEIAKNEAQWEEWEQLFTLSELPKDLFNGGPAADRLTILQQQPFLVLDTRFFSEDFKNRLIAEFDDLDAETDGLLVNSENFQALELLQERYKEDLSTIYTDPPYNTASTPILYKNEYKHSSWAALMYDRLKRSLTYTKDTSVITVAIDDAEMVNLSQILELVAPNHRLSKVTVVHNPKGSITKDFNRVHEYALFLTREDKKNCIARALEENETPRKMRRWGANSLRTERRLSFYPIYVKDNKIVRIGDVPEDDFHPRKRNVAMQNGEIAIYPIDQNGIERRWNFGLDSIEKNLDRVTIQEVDGTLDLFLTHELSVPKTVWKGGIYDAGSYGNTLLINMLGNKKFDFPKSIHLVKRCIYLSTDDGKGTVLDYFAGSGTTAHAVINLNREDGGRRKYILVEMGEYFHTVTKPRIQKVIYSEDWKDGKPVSRKGSSHLFKYIRLESYEDTLNNLRVVRKAQQQNVLELNDTFYEEYLLGYMLDTETSDSLLSIQDFADPFNYQLTITENNEPKPTIVDMVETFNYLIGLKVATIKTIDGFRVVTGTKRTGEPTLVIWRNTSEKDDAALRSFFSQYMEEEEGFEPLHIYINGDNTVASLRKDTDNWTIYLTEQAFLQEMFVVQDI